MQLERCPKEKILFIYLVYFSDFVFVRCNISESNGDRISTSAIFDASNSIYTKLVITARVADM